MSAARGLFSSLPHQYDQTLDHDIIFCDDDRRCLGASLLEPISKLSEKDNEAGELDEAEEVVGVIFPADQDATLPLYPGEEALNQPTLHVTA